MAEARVKNAAADWRALRLLVIGAGCGASALFIVCGLAFDLQTYGDGSIFSYAVAAQDVWAFHWRNIATRMTSYALTLAPGEAAVALSGSPDVGVFVYGLCLFSAPAVSLAATFALDRAPGRPYFLGACATTALVCPLVFGFPTEMWIAQGVFWPCFACAMTARAAFVSGALVVFLMVALALSHEGGLVLGFGVVVACALRGLRERRFFRALAAYGLALGVWLCVDRFLPPDAYFAAARSRAAFEFFSARIFASPALLLIIAALGLYALTCALFARVVGRAATLATLLVALALVLWWALFDSALHADNRYYLRTVLLLGTCGFASVAGLAQLAAEGMAFPRPAILAGEGRFARGLIGAFVLILLIHVVETGKFLRGFAAYRAAIRVLAVGEVADPALGAPFLVSARRISADLNRFSWFSTTPYLSALVADFRPKRLVVDPAGNYFWLACATAATAAREKGAIPQATREMIAVYSCLHRD